MIEDLLYIEVENSCAYCGQHGLPNLTEHHIDHDRTNNEYDNKIILCHNCHHRYHNNKGISKEDILKLKYRLIQKTLTQYGVNALKIAYRNDFGVVAIPFLLHHLADLGYMSQKETIEAYGQDDVPKQDQPVVEGQEITIVDALVRFTITEKGRDLYRKWFLRSP